MKLLLVEGYSKPEKSQLDKLFYLKEELYHYCLWYIARLQAKGDLAHIPLLQTAPHSSMLASIIRQDYRHLQIAVQFDKAFTEVLWEAAEGQREEYRKLQISDGILKTLNDSPLRPKFLSPPLVYTDDGISSLYSGKFWGRLDVDLFGHYGLIIKSGDRGRYFATYEARRKYNTFTQPFLVRQDLENDFLSYGVTFSDTFDILKGLFNSWFHVF